MYNLGELIVACVALLVFVGAYFLAGRYGPKASKQLGMGFLMGSGILILIIFGGCLILSLYVREMMK